MQVLVTPDAAKSPAPVTNTNKESAANKKLMQEATSEGSTEASADEIAQVGALAAYFMRLEVEFLSGKVTSRVCGLVAHVR